MATKRRPRKKAPRIARRKRPKNTVASARLKELWQTPEFRERMRVRTENMKADRKANPEKYKRTGTPDGMNKHKAAKLWAKAHVLADRFIQIMKDTGQLPDEMVEVTMMDDDGVEATTTVAVPANDTGKAERALREAFVLAVGPSTQQIKMQAIKTVLDFTKSKPESKAKITVNPLAFLDEIAKPDDGSAD